MVVWNAMKTQQRNQTRVRRAAATIAASAFLAIGGIAATAPAANACTVNPTSTCESNYNPGTEEDWKNSMACVVTGVGSGLISGPGGAAAYTTCQVNNILFK